jgi:hypothetical protein
MTPRMMIALLLCLLAGACNRDDPFARADVAQLRGKVVELEGRVRVLELSRQASAERPVTLTQTWLTPDQPPATSQSTFRSPEACEAARKRLLADAERILADRDRQSRNDAEASGLDITVDKARPLLQAACSG